MSEWVFYVGAALSSGVYALYLESLDKRFEPDWTWVMVMGGVILTGCWVGLMMRWGDVPVDLPPMSLVWWVCWRWVFMFLATGAVIVAWQIWQMRARLLDALRYARGDQ
jgi:hypothetical protein